MGKMSGGSGQLLMLACLLGALVRSEGGPQGGPRTLVLADDLSLATTHSIFLSQLEARGHAVTISKADNASLSLTHHGEYVYENVVIFSPMVEEFGGALDVAEVMEFVDSGRNLLIAISPASSNNLRAIASECGIIPDVENAFVQDHFKYDTAVDDGSHTTVTSVKLIDSPTIVGQEAKNAILFRGTGLAASPSSSSVIPVLRGHCTTYSALLEKPITPASMTPGKKTMLVAALQARNNARCTVSGSLALFSDSFYNSELATGGVSGNRLFGDAVAAWTLGERGIVRAVEMSYRVKGDAVVNPKTLRIKDEVEFIAVIAEGVDGWRWAPYDGGNVQLDMVMMDPRVRVNMHYGGKGRYTATVNVPDVHGVYHFSMRVGRVGYSSVEGKVEVPVRPFRHDEHERFLLAAYPYYTSALSMVAATVAIALVVLYSDSPRPKKE